MRSFISLLAAVILPFATAAAQPRFEISFPQAAHAGPVTGRVYVAISRTNDRPPVQRAGEAGVPLFGVNVEQPAPGKAAVIDARAFGFPARSLRDIPAGDY